MALPRYPIGEESTLQYYEPAELARFDLSGVTALDGKGSAVLNAARGLQGGSGRGGGFRAGLDKAVNMYTELHNNVLVPHYGAKPINRLFGAGQGAKPQGAVAQAPMKGGSSFSIGDTGRSFSDPNVGVGDFGSSFGIGGGTPKTGVSFEPHGGYGDNFSTIPQSEFKSGDPRDPSPYQGDPFKEEAPAGTFAPTTPAPPAVVSGLGPIPQSRLGAPNATDTFNVSEPMGDVNEDYDVPVDETFGGGDSGMFELDTLGPGSGVSGKITADTLKPGSGISAKIPADTRGPVDSEFEKVDMSSGFSETVPPITADTLSPDRFGGGVPLSNPFDIPLSGDGAIGAGTSSEGVKAVVDSAIEEFKRTGNGDALMGLINNLSERVRVLGDLAGLGQATPEQLLELSSGSELLQYIRESLRVNVDIDGGVDPQGNLTPGLRPDDIDSAMELIPNETGGVRAW